jgi:cytidylate kinase
MPKITIAIDGYSSTGKSTVAKQLADRLGYVYVDKLIAALPDISLKFIKNSLGKTEMYLNGVSIEKEIRTMEVSDYVSPVAAIPEVRRKLVKLQHEMGEHKGVVMDGRDIGTVVFPNAELKIFMNATAKERARRRFNELSKLGDNVSYDEVYQNVTERDHLDTTRIDSPLMKADDAIEIDNSEMNIEDQFHIILQLAQDRIAGRI